MCLACIEYIKGNMRLKEYKAAIRETILGDNRDHAEKAQEIMYDHQGSEEDLKKKLQAIGETGKS